MSYPQFGYPYSSAPQFLMTTNSLTTCFESSGRTVAESGAAASHQTPVYCPVYESRLLATARHELNSAAALGVYGNPYTSSQGYGNYVTYGTDASAFYPLSTFDSKDGSGSAHAGITHAAAYYPYDATLGPYQYDRYGTMDVGTRRKNATRETTSTLKAWLQEHRKNPYPTKGEKIMLAIITKMTLTQVSTWFANARRRLKKENKVTWGARDKDDEDGNIFGSDNEGDVEKNEDDEEIDLESIDIDKIDENDGEQSNEEDEEKLESRDHGELVESMEKKQDLTVQAPVRYDKSKDMSVVKEPSESNNTRVISPIGQGNLQMPSNNKPKIWSLAETATSPDSSQKPLSPSAPSSHSSPQIQHPAFLPNHGLYTCQIGKFHNWTNGAFLSQNSLLNVRSFLGVNQHHHHHNHHLHSQQQQTSVVTSTMASLSNDKSSESSSLKHIEQESVLRTESPTQPLKSPFQPTHDSPRNQQEATQRVLTALSSA